MDARRELSHPLDAALARLRQKSGVSVAFGGPVRADGNLVLERFDGPTFGALTGLTVSLGQGLGGKVVALRRTAAVNDYFDSHAITHTYDQIIRVEGLRAVVASPIVIHRRPVAVIYGAYRNDEVVGGRVQDAITQEARSLEQQAVVNEALTESKKSRSALELENVGLREQLRAADAQLRRLAATVDDRELRSALDRVIRSLTDAPGMESNSAMASLTNRETDVLSLAGLGLSNAKIAESLGLTVQTIKSYMKSAMSKLGADSRLEAVVLARRARMIA